MEAIGTILVVLLLMALCISAGYMLGSLYAKRYKKIEDMHMRRHRSTCNRLKRTINNLNKIP